ncbi:MAG TPA: hypothetical protein VFV75_18910 [Candidatus Polarisedimenticolaceae bacterium]|nr:hypothetical protein [Candidatus Polarisedimenticolaceae bacterium]
MQRLVLLIALLAGLAEEPAPAPPHLPSPHVDGKATEQAVLDATLAFLREDLSAARPALDRIEAGCKRLREDDREAYGGEIMSYDKAFHAALDVSREMASAGDLQRSWEQFMWVTKGCRACHALARTPPRTGKARAH